MKPHIDTAQLLEQWLSHYDPQKNIPGLTNARRNYYQRLHNSLQGLLSTEAATLEALTEKLHTLIPELLEANDLLLGGEPVLKETDRADGFG